MPRRDDRREPALYEDFLRVRIPGGRQEEGEFVPGNVTLEIISDLMSFVHYGFDGFNVVLAGFDRVEFLEPVYVGDVVHAVGRVVQVGNRSRVIECEAYRIAEGPPKTGVGPLSSAARRWFEDPPLVARTRAVVVMPRDAYELQQRTGRVPVTSHPHPPGGPGPVWGIPSKPSLFEDFTRLRMPPWHEEQDGYVAGVNTLEVISELTTFVHLGFDRFNTMLAGYDDVRFLAPVYGGDVLHAVARITRVGDRSRTVECEVYRIAEGPPKLGVGPISSSTRRWFQDPPLVATSRAVTVLSREAHESQAADGTLRPRGHIEA